MHRQTSNGHGRDTTNGNGDTDNQQQSSSAIGPTITQAGYWEFTTVPPDLILGSSSLEVPTYRRDDQRDRLYAARIARDLAASGTLASPGRGSGSGQALAATRGRVGTQQPSRQPFFSRSVLPNVSYDGNPEGYLNPPSHQRRTQYPMHAWNPAAMPQPVQLQPVFQRGYTMEDQVPRRPPYGQTPPMQFQPVDRRFVLPSMRSLPGLPHSSTPVLTHLSQQDDSESLSPRSQPRQGNFRRRAEGIRWRESIAEESNGASTHGRKRRHRSASPSPSADDLPDPVATSSRGNPGLPPRYFRTPVQSATEPQRGRNVRQQFSRDTPWDATPGPSSRVHRYSEHMPGYLADPYFNPELFSQELQDSQDTYERSGHVTYEELSYQPPGPSSVSPYEQLGYQPPGQSSISAYEQLGNQPAGQPTISAYEQLGYRSSGQSGQTSSHQFGQGVYQQSASNPSQLPPVLGSSAQRLPRRMSTLIDPYTESISYVEQGGINLLNLPTFSYASATQQQGHYAIQSPMEDTPQSMTMPGLDRASQQFAGSTLSRAEQNLGFDPVRQSLGDIHADQLEDDPGIGDRNAEQSPGHNSGDT
ncbi:hypothetical protein N0V90_003823 [Kalmusia sp. IMI 367209]|nr:hypothetical protein N0V90_003823 [Kalmusia sp. IMI 367209]